MKKILTLSAMASMAILIGCGDDSSSSSNEKSNEVVSCYIYDILDDETNEVSESCVEAVAGTKDAEKVTSLCKMMQQFTDENEKTELGKGCPSDKKAKYTCDATGDLNYTHLYYVLDDDQKKLVVKDDEAKTCDKLIAEEKGNVDLLISDDEEEEETVSCYMYTVVDEETNDIDESCITAIAGTTYADTLKMLCDLFAEGAEGTSSKATFGKSCPEKKALYTCLDAEYDSATDETKIMTYTYYTLDSERKDLVVKGDNDATCDNLIEYENEDIEDSGDEEEADEE